MMALDRYEFDFIDWQDKGYFGCPGPGNAPKFPTNPIKKPWYAVAVVIYEAKHGNFNNISRLLEITDKELGGTLDDVCTHVIGDAGPDSCYPDLINLIQNENYEFTFQACQALSTRGRLGDIAVLLDAFEANQDISDSDIISTFIRQVLDPGDYSLSVHPETDGFANYRTAIETHVMDLCNKFGRDDVCVWRGDIFSLERVACWVVDWVPKTDFFPMDVRRRLEATSGINCSEFYLKGVFQPLSAIAVSEKILESNLVDRLQADTRYFYGHKIP